MATAAEISLWLATDKNAARHLDAVLSHQTPEVQQQVKAVIKQYEFARDGGGRFMPFQERVTTKDVCDHNGLAQPEVAERVYQNLVDTAVTVGLQQRMGTDASLPPPDITLRDQIEASLDMHTILDPLKE